MIFHFRFDGAGDAIVPGPAEAAALKGQMPVRYTSDARKGQEEARIEAIAADISKSAPAFSFVLVIKVL